MLPASFRYKVCLCPKPETDGSLRCGDEILVQVEKDAVKTKQPVVTTKISLSGKYLVLSMGSLRTGFSKKLPKEKKESRFSNT